MLRYGLIGDAHLGFKAYGSDKRTAECLQVFEQCVDALKDLPVICLAGDMFDDTSIPNWVKREVIRIKEKLPEQVWVVCGGNHDSTKTYSSVSALDVFGEVHNVMVVNSFEIEMVHVEGINIIVIPHMKSQKDFLAAVDHWLEQEVHWDVCLMHCMVHSELDLSPNDLNIDMHRLSLLARQCKQIWIGHEHTPKQVLPNVWVPGGIMEFDFGQLGTKFVYKVEGSELTQIPLHQPRKMKLLELDWEGPMQLLSLPLADDTIYKIVVNFIPAEQYSSAKIAMDSLIDKFSGDIIYSLLKTGHKELQITAIDARFDLLEEFQEFVDINKIPHGADMLSRLEDAVSEILSEEEDNL